MKMTTVTTTKPMLSFVFGSTVVLIASLFLVGKLNSNMIHYFQTTATTINENTKDGITIEAIGLVSSVDIDMCTGADANANANANTNDSTDVDNSADDKMNGNCSAVNVTTLDNVTSEDKNKNNDEVWCDECDSNELYDELVCADFESIEKPVPTLEDYMIMRRTYEDVVGKEKSTISPLSEENCFMIPYRAGQADGNKGRGIFAIDFIPKGTPVFSSRQVATFYDGKSVRTFLSKIPRTLACDYLYWVYTVWDYQYKGYKQSVDLDDGSLCNDSINEETTNVGCDVEASQRHEGSGNDKEDCQKYWYAIKDIQPGDELLCMYSSFVGNAYGGEHSEENENVGATELGLGWSDDNYPPANY
mmetsp:Transcript_11228/g.12716  ORF Transcript_11228/g.12716 Transcript_11228/m.12716 type:complete len:361 (-) Transcript_11228:26-1108(-)